MYVHASCLVFYFNDNTTGTSWPGGGCMLGRVARHGVSLLPVSDMEKLYVWAIAVSKVYDWL